MTARRPLARLGAWLVIALGLLTWALVLWPLAWLCGLLR